MTFTVEYEQDSDGRWLAEVLELPGVLPTVKLPTVKRPIRQSQNRRPSRFAYWPIALSMVKALLSSLLFLLPPHEPMVFC